jgi:hypothetical protein
MPAMSTVFVSEPVCACTVRFPHSVRQSALSHLFACRHRDEDDPRRQLAVTAIRFLEATGATEFLFEVGRSLAWAAGKFVLRL